MADQQKIQKADPAARRRGIILVLLFVIPLVLLMQLAESTMQGWLEKHLIEAAGNPLKFAAFAALFSLPLAGFAMYLYALGRRVISDNRFPPHNMKTIRDTRIVTGKSARLRGIVLLGLAIGFLLMTFVIPVVFWIVLRTVVA